MDRETTGCSDRWRYSSGGFSLLELVVATLLLSLVMLIASQVLLDTQRFAALAQQELTPPDAGLALLRLRGDARASNSIRTRTREGQRRLELTGAADRGRGKILYFLDDEELIREVVDRSGSGISRGTLLRGVEYFRWRRIDRGLLEIELQTRPVGTVGAPTTNAAASHRWLRVALRNRTTSRW